MSSEDHLRELDQLSAAEVPGFHARTVIDDTIGKLYALRAHLKVDLSNALPALLDDLEAQVEALLEAAYDPETPAIEKDSGIVTPPHLHKSHTAYRLRATASSALGFCSCGGIWLDTEVAGCTQQQAAASAKRS